MRHRSHLTILFLAIIALTACDKGNPDDMHVQYIPFQEEEDGLWGLISPSGKVLFGEEFEHTPTVVRNNRFFVRNDDGLYELYEASEHPKQIGGEYKQATAFYDGVALVVEKGKPVTLIDTQGKVLKTLDKIGSKTIERVWPFAGKYAIVETDDDHYGAIDTKGNCVIEPKYAGISYMGEDLFCVIPAKYADEPRSKTKATVLTAGGEELFELSLNKYEDFGRCQEGKIKVAVEKNGRTQWGLIDKRGETVLAPSKKVSFLGELRGKYFVFGNENDDFGLMGIDGEIVLRAKYDLLFFVGKGKLAAKMDGEYKIINTRGETLSGEGTYPSIAFDNGRFDGKHTFARPDDNSWVLIDANGKTLKGLPDIYDWEYETGSSSLTSDYIDINAFLKKFQFSTKGALGITFASSPKQVVDKAYALDCTTHDTPYWFDMTSRQTLRYRQDGTEGVFVIQFPDRLSRWRGNTSYSDKSDYAWNTITPSSIEFSFNNGGKMASHMRDLYEAICQMFLAQGEAIDRGKDYVTFELRNNMHGTVRFDDDSVEGEWFISEEDIEAEDAVEVVCDTVCWDPAVSDTCV